MSIEMHNEPGGPENGGHYHAQFVLSRLCLLGIPIHGVLIFAFDWLDQREMSIFNIGSTLAWVSAYVLIRRGSIKPASAILMTEIILHAIFAVHFLGWESGFQYYLVPTIVLVLFLDVIPESFSLVSAILVACIYLTLLITAESHPGGIDHGILLLMKHVNMALSLVALILIGYFYRKSTDVSESTLGEMARTDPLTGLLNRRGAYEVLQEHIQRCGSRGGTVSVVIADVDNFKQVNDRYGHACGDTVLREVSTLLREGLRSSDMVARWGGEEFLLLLPGSAPGSARTVCEKLRSGIETHVVECGNERISCTVTFGIAGYQPGEDVASVISNADRMLYAGKQAGRNRVEVWNTHALPATAPS